MSLGEFIKYCPECHINILTTKQAEEKKPCWDCQLKHTSEFHKKFNIDSVDEKHNR